MKKLTENFGGGGLITMYSYGSFEKQTAGGGTPKVDNKRRI
nr:hypothetical protein [Mediterraneibacter faecis]